jgi:hypothetical protein
MNNTRRSLSGPRLWPLLVFMLSIGLVLPSLGRDREARIDGQLKVKLPAALRPLLMSRPHAQVMVEIGADGKLGDIMPFSATHYGLIEKAVEAVAASEGIPAIVEGEPRSARVLVYVNFYDPEQEAWLSGLGGLPQGNSVSEALERRLYQSAPHTFTYGESEVSELDEQLTLKETKFRLYTSQEGKKATGRCVVEYFVGPEGQVHFPRIVSTDHDDLGMSALLTLESTTFEPPRRRGHPTWVKVRQPFNFR